MLTCAAGWFVGKRADGDRWKTRWANLTEIGDGEWVPCSLRGWVRSQVAGWQLLKCTEGSSSRSCTVINGTVRKLNWRSDRDRGKRTWFFELFTISGLPIYLCNCDYRLFTVSLMIDMGKWLHVSNKQRVQNSLLIRACLVVSSLSVCVGVCCGRVMPPPILGSENFYLFIEISKYLIWVISFVWGRTIVENFVFQLF